MVDRDDILEPDDEEGPVSQERFSRDQAKMDQCSAWLGDTYPSLWRRIYEGNKRQGFTDAESLKLVMCYILSQAPNGIRGTDT